MFGVGGSPFTPAPDMPEWVQATFLDKASPVANPEHAHIGYLWAAVEKRKGKRVIGQCETGTPQGAMGTWAKARVEQQITDWFGSLPDFIITLDANYCAACGDAEFMALVEPNPITSLKTSIPSAPRSSTARPAARSSHPRA
jgi:hypothetical protein